MDNLPNPQVVKTSSSPKLLFILFLVIPFLAALALIYFLMPKQIGQKFIQTLKIPLKCPVEKDFCKSAKEDGLNLSFSNIASNSAIFAVADGKLTSDTQGTKKDKNATLFTITNQGSGFKITYEFIPRVYTSAGTETDIKAGDRFARIAKGDLIIFAQDPKTGASFKLTPAQLN